MALWGCENDGVLDVTDIEVPDGYTLSAGTSTVFKNSSFAYDTDADWVANIPANERRFTHGDRLYDNPMNSGNGMRDTAAARATAMPGVQSLPCGPRRALTPTGHPSMARDSTDSAVCWSM